VVLWLWSCGEVRLGNVGMAGDRSVTVGWTCSGGCVECQIGQRIEVRGLTLKVIISFSATTIARQSHLLMLE